MLPDAPIALFWLKVSHLCTRITIRYEELWLVVRIDSRVLVVVGIVVMELVG